MGEHEFEGFEVAELMHARGLATSEGEAICRRYLERGTWKRVPGEWATLAERLTRREGATVDRLGWFEAWLDTVREESVDAPHAEVLRTEFYGLLDSGAALDDKLRVASKLSEWLCAKAGPGAMGCCAEVLWQVGLEFRRQHEQRRADAGRIADAFVGLVRRIVQVGVAELRSSRHPELLAFVIGVLECHGPTDLLVAAFEILIAGGHDQHMWRISHQNYGLWRMTEAALVAGLPPTRCWDIVVRSNLDVRDRWAPLVFEDVPHCTQALIAGLGNGGIPSDIAREGWTMAALYREPSESEFVEQPSQAAIQLLSDVLWRDVVPQARYGFTERYLAEGERSNCARVGRWVEFAVNSTLGLAGSPSARESRRFVAHHLEHLVAWSGNLVEDAPNLAVPLLRWLEQVPPDDRALALATKVLRDNPNPLVAAVAAIKCLASTPAGPSEPSSDTWLDTLRIEFERFACLPWNQPIAGIRMNALLRGVTRAAFVDDLKELVIVTDKSINLHPAYYRDVHRRKGAGDESMALCMLYFVHELLHVPQGISEGAMVQRLRAVGAEITLMHLDLTADHAAILLVHHAVPRWSIAWLKRLVASSLESFPASNFHTHAARARKSLRMVSSRVDALAREQARKGLDQLGYLFIDFSPAGGDLFLLASGPPMQILACTPLSAHEAKELNAAAEPPRPEPAKGLTVEPIVPVKSFAAIDSVLARLLAEWRPSA